MDFDELCEKDGEKDFHGLFSSELHELRQENKELRTRVAEQEKSYERGRSDGFYEAYINDEGALIAYTEDNDRLKKDNAELNKRVAELEKKNNILKKTISTPEQLLMIRQAFEESWKENYEKLKSKLSTLLKASEGMEKALEEVLIVVQHNKVIGEIGWHWSPTIDFRYVDGWKKQLADFRAVKEGFDSRIPLFDSRQPGLLNKPASGVIREAGFSFCRKIVEEGDHKCHIAKSKSLPKSRSNFRSRRQALLNICTNSVRTELKNACNGASLLLRLTAVAVALTTWTPSSTASASIGSSPALNTTNAINAIIGEAEAEPMEGKIAIAEVIRNKGNLRGVYGINSPRVRLASRAVRKDSELAWAKKGTNLTRGATVWGNADDVRKWKARAKKYPRHWFNRMHQTAQIGRHFFFAERKSK